MPFRVNCPSCKSAYVLSEEALGKKLMCKKCQKPFTVGNAKPPAPPPPKPVEKARPKAAEIQARPSIKSPPRREPPAAAAPQRTPIVAGKSPRQLLWVAGAVLVLVVAIAAGAGGAIYFLRQPDKAPVAVTAGPSASAESEKPPSQPAIVEPKIQADTTAPTPPSEKSTTPPREKPASPTNPPPSGQPPPPPPTPTPQADAARIKITNPRFTKPMVSNASTKYEAENKRWVYSLHTVNNYHALFYIDVLPADAPTSRDAYAEKLLQKDFQEPGQQFTEISEKSDLPDGFFIKGVVKNPGNAKPDFAFVLVRKVNGAYLRCRSGTVANRPIPTDELRQAMRDVFQLATIRTTTLVSLPPPSGSALLRDNVTLVVSQAETAHLIYFDTVAEREVKRVEVDFQPGELAVQGDTLFAAAKGSALVYALDAATGKVKKEHNLGGNALVHLACHPRRGLLYASTTNFGLVALEPASGVVTPIKGLGQFLAVSPDGKFVYTGVQPPDRDEIEVIFRRDGRMQIYSDMWGPRAMLAKYEVNGTNLRFVAGQNNAAVNGWWMQLTPDGKRLMMVGGGGWRPPKEGGTDGGYFTAVYNTDDLKSIVQRIPFSGLNTIFHPVLNLGAANSYGINVTLFNAKSLVKRTTIELSPEREQRPLLLTFGAKGRKLILWNGDNVQKEQGLHFLPLPLKPEEEAALVQAEKKPLPAEEPIALPADKPSPSKVKIPKTPEEAEAAIKNLGGEIYRNQSEPGKPITEVSFDTMSKITDDELVVLSPITTLVQLRFWKNESITDKGIDYLAKHQTGLRRLTLVKTSITDAALASVAQFKRLGYLNITGGQITDRGLEPLKQLEMLTILTLKELSEVTDAGLEQVKKLVHLTHLDLSECRITDLGLAQLKDLKELESLTLNGNKEITDRGLDHLKGLKRLRDLALGRTSVTAKGIAKLKEALPHANITK